MPSEAVMFLSEGWGGRVSEKKVSVEFFDKISMGDCTLADRGFNFKEELTSLSAALQVPYLTKRKSLLSGKEADTSRQLSNVRIYVKGSLDN